MLRIFRPSLKGKVDQYCCTLSPSLSNLSSNPFCLSSAPIETTITVLPGLASAVFTAVTESSTARLNRAVKLGTDWMQLSKRCSE